MYNEQTHCTNLRTLALSEIEKGFEGQGYVFLKVIYNKIHLVVTHLTSTQNKDSWLSETHSC